MEKIESPFFYKLGAELKPLTQFTCTSTNRIDIMVASFSIHQRVKDLLSRFPSLTICRPAANELIASINFIVDWFKKTPQDKQQEENFGTDYVFRTAVQNAKTFETVLLAELETLAIYHVTQKGIYSTPDLIDHTEGVFPAIVLQKMNPNVIDEIRQSGKCLAFDNATSSAFHIIRATEAILHEYYCAVCKPKPKPSRLDSWAQYIAELYKSKDAEVKEVVAMLQQFKDRHRNLIMHPEITLSPDEAFTLFEMAKGTIIVMSRKLPTIKSKIKQQKNAAPKLISQHTP